MALACAVALSGCGDKVTKNYGTSATTGALNINITPASASVHVTGAAGFSQTFVGNHLYAGLAPGQYTAKATASGYVDATNSINVVAGQTSSISMILAATAPIIASPRAAYRDAAGNLIPLDAAALQTGQFVFYAWLRNDPLGIVPGNLTGATTSDPGRPLGSEQTEIAPSFTQNLAAAWVGFKDASGAIRPVIGADVRWEIDQWWSDSVGSTQFGTSDDNRVALGYGVFDDQADTRTNNARLEAERFPLIASDYPLFNATGIATPFVDGFTWVTLFSPDATASARIVAVAVVDGEEVGKQILTKGFAPAPQIVITKTVSDDIVNLVGNQATVTWTVTVKNVGMGDATSVDLSDFLTTLNGANYTLGALPAGVVQTGDSFTYAFPLASASTPAPDQTAQRLGNAQSFAVLANSTVTNTGSSVVSGNVGVSAGSAVTGFPPGVVQNGTIHNNDAVAVAAQTALTAAYTALAAKPCTDATNKALTGTFTPGIYCYSSAAALSGPLVLDAQGDPTAEFVFKTGSTLTTPAGSSVTLINGASACNVYWIVGSSATLGTSTSFIGNILAEVSITANTTASIAGRALARTGTVTLDGNEISAPLSCVPIPQSTKTLTFTATVNAPGTYCNEADITAFTGGNGTTTPADLNAQACFTALESKVSIVKDFVAADDTTSLGKAVTVKANEAARLRVRVINSGGGDATAVVIKDALDAGASTPYEIIAVPAGTTANAQDGFDTTIATLASGATTTMLFSVRASADGEYCDTASIESVGTGVIGIGSETACLTVATPILTITKDDAPATVLPGGNYTSTIVVENTGNATARRVVISDLIGLNSTANVRAVYVSSSLGGLSGTLANNVVTTGAIDIPAGETRTFTVVSRIPLAAVSGTYCDFADATSSNAASPAQATDCVFVPAFSALQTQLVDRADPISVGGGVTYFSVLYVEALSNEGVGENKLTYSFGLVNPTVLGIPGVFQVTATKVYLDNSPVRDAVTGLVVSDTSSASATLLTEGTDYTLVTQLGKQVITMTSGVVLQPNTALYVVNDVLVPTGTPSNHLYTTSYIWDSVGLVDPAHTYQASSSEPTTVVQ